MIEIIATHVIALIVGWGLCKGYYSKEIRRND